MAPSPVLRQLDDRRNPAELAHWETVEVTVREYPPGMQAPASGTYEQRNVLGSSTGTRVTVAQGEQLPAAPRGFTWRIIEARGTGDGCA